MSLCDGQLKQTPQRVQIAESFSAPWRVPDTLENALCNSVPPKIHLET